MSNSRNLIIGISQKSELVNPLLLKYFEHDINIDIPDLATLTSIFEYHTRKLECADSIYILINKLVVSLNLRMLLKNVLDL